MSTARVGPGTGDGADDAEALPRSTPRDEEDRTVDLRDAPRYASPLREAKRWRARAERRAALTAAACAAAAVALLVVVGISVMSGDTAGGAGTSSSSSGAATPGGADSPSALAPSVNRALLPQR